MSTQKFTLTPKTMSEKAQAMWIEQKQDFDYPEEMRMAFIMGAMYGMQHMEQELRPFKVDA